MIRNINPQETAHIIIDIQVDFCSDKGASAKYPGRLEQIQSIIPTLRHFSKDLKSRKILTVYTQFISSEEVAPKNMQDIFQNKHGKFSPMCLANTKGAELYLLEPDKEDIILQKHSYDSFAGTNLNKILKKRGIKNLILSGVRTEICVDSTAKRAFAEGYNVFLSSDTTATTSDAEQLHHLLLESFNKHYGYVMDSNNLLNMLSNNVKS